jgi:hypothetical protein
MHGLRADGCCWQAAFAGADPLWAEEEHRAVFVSLDGWSFEGTFCGLCPLHGVLTDAHSCQWRVTYSGNEPLAVDLKTVTKEVTA